MPDTNRIDPRRPHWKQWCSWMDDACGAFKKNVILAEHVGSVCGILNSASSPPFPPPPLPKSEVTNSDASDR